ncbi:MAG: tryptophan--tRNA ligase [Termitinemataceae bacterium]|nr:MAG: tryptophan--tRNA ligase [Termitinemataceae bacterium]
MSKAVKTAESAGNKITTVTKNRIIAHQAHICYTIKMKVSLTGIKPTGILHIGNYFGAIKPAIALCQNYDSRYFIADYHALNIMKDADELKLRTREVAAGWLAAGLDPDKVIFYRQSDVSETFELSTILMAFTSKGLMNRAHAYKASVDVNKEKGEDTDSGINMGLYTYPVLMAADILLFDSDVVPVGKDQVQHIEMAQDIAQSLNFNYKKELLKIPQPLVSETVAVVPGLDGRKMSKSYGNTIPLFIEEKQLRRLIMRIVTNSQGVEEIKNPDDSQIFALYKLFANTEEQASLASLCRSGGMGWGTAKEELFRVVNRELSPVRERFNAFISDPKKLDEILLHGAEKARSIASKTIQRLRDAIGIS